MLSEKNCYTVPRNAQSKGHTRISQICCSYKSHLLIGNMHGGLLPAITRQYTSCGIGGERKMYETEGDMSGTQSRSDCFSSHRNRFPTSTSAKHVSTIWSSHVPSSNSQAAIVLPYKYEILHHIFTANNNHNVQRQRSTTTPNTRSSSGILTRTYTPRTPHAHEDPPWRSALHNVLAALGTLRARPQHTRHVRRRRQEAVQLAEHS